MDENRNLKQRIEATEYMKKGEKRRHNNLRYGNGNKR